MKLKVQLLLLFMILPFIISAGAQDRLQDRDQDRTRDQISINAGRGGGGDTGYGNNLSYPVVFAEGYGITGVSLSNILPWNTYDSAPNAGDATGLRPLATETFTAFPSLVEPYAANPTYYAQNTVNTWRAEWTQGTPGTPELVQVDWGDNLISQSWTATKPVRVETVLRQPTPMTGYPMVSLLGSRRTETQGTTGQPEGSLGRTVFSITGHLLIQKYDSTWTNVLPNACSVDAAVYNNAGEGTGGYAAEVNVSGTVIYGYNWMLNQCSDPDKVGNWRITFKLDDTTTGGVVRNVKIVGAADMSSNITTVRYSDYESSLDIKIVSTRTGGRRGGGNQ